MKNSYTVVVERDPESGWLIGEVVELPGCYTQAPDLSSLESNVREAISAYIKTASPGEPLPDSLVPGVLRYRLDQTPPGYL